MSIQRSSSAWNAAFFADIFFFVAAFGALIPPLFGDQGGQLSSKKITRQQKLLRCWAIAILVIVNADIFFFVAAFGALIPPLFADEGLISKYLFISL